MKLLLTASLLSIFTNLAFAKDTSVVSKDEFLKPGFKPASKLCSNLNIGVSWSADSKKLFYITKDERNTELDISTLEKRSIPSRPKDQKQKNFKKRGSSHNSEKSPNGKLRVEINNSTVKVYDTSKPETALATYKADAGLQFAHGFCYWAPDSSKFVIYNMKPGQRRKLTVIDKEPKGQTTPKVISVHYDTAGDKVDVYTPVTFFSDNKPAQVVSRELCPNPYSTFGVLWRDSHRFSFEYVERGFGKHSVIEQNTLTNKQRLLINETSDTFIFTQGNSFVHHTADNKEIIWRSERDGFNHFYLYDKVSGKVKNQITKGEWVTRDVLDINEKERTILFTANGVHKGQDPYFIHLCKVNFDGTGFKALTSSNGTHQILLSPDKKHFYCNWSSTNKANIHELRSINGNLLKVLAQGDISELAKQSNGFPEPFSTTDRDGKHKIYGWVLKPKNFDKNKKYPVIERIYSGPHGQFVSKGFFPWHDAMAELARQGYFVVCIDGKGTNYRGKDFSHFAYKNIDDAGFPDRIKWIKELGKKFPQMDLDRVGIFGASAGGQSSTGALINHNHFYKVAASDCGCHDNRLDKIWWNEQWMDYPVGPHYAEQSNIVNASKLKGHLMLTVGEIDTNVNPINTYNLSKALNKANIKHKLISIPSKGHGAGNGPDPRYQRYLFFKENL